MIKKFTSAAIVALFLAIAPIIVYACGDYPCDDASYSGCHKFSWVENNEPNVINEVYVFSSLLSKDEILSLIDSMMLEKHIEVEMVYETEENVSENSVVCLLLGHSIGAGIWQTRIQEIFCNQRILRGIRIIDYWSARCTRCGLFAGTWTEYRTIWF